MWAAWQGERFARVDKLKPFKAYRKEVRPAKAKQKQTDREKLDVFRSLQAAGTGIKITRIPKK